MSPCHVVRSSVNRGRQGLQWDRSCLENKKREWTTDAWLDRGTNMRSRKECKATSDFGALATRCWRKKDNLGLQSRIERSQKVLERIFHTRLPLAHTSLTCGFDIDGWRVSASSPFSASSPSFNRLASWNQSSIHMGSFLIEPFHFFSAHRPSTGLYNVLSDPYGLVICGTNWSLLRNLEINLEAANTFVLFNVCSEVKSYSLLLPSFLTPFVPTFVRAVNGSNILPLISFAYYVRLRSSNSKTRPIFGDLFTISRPTDQLLLLPHRHSLICSALSLLACIPSCDILFICDTCT